jgi:hypothetical protein
MSLASAMAQRPYIHAHRSNSRNLSDDVASMLLRFRTPYYGVFRDAKRLVRVEGSADLC